MPAAQSTSVPRIRAASRRPSARPRRRGPAVGRPRRPRGNAARRQTIRIARPGPGRRGAHADQECQAGLEPVPLGGILHDRTDGRGELVGCFVRTVRFQDVRLTLDDLPQGPEGDALPVGQASALPPAPARAASRRRRGTRAPGDSSRPRLAGHRDELHRSLPHGARVHGLQERQLVAAADEGRGRRLRGIGAVSTAGGFGLPHPDRLGRSFDRDRLERFVVHEMPGRPIGRLVDHHRADRGDGLEAGRRVDHVARRNALAFHRPGPTRHDRFPGGHGAPGEPGLSPGSAAFSSWTAWTTRRPARTARSASSS